MFRLKAITFVALGLFLLAAAGAQAVGRPLPIGLPDLTALQGSREETRNPAGQELSLPPEAQAPHRNPVWDGGAPGLAQGRQAPVDVVEWDNPAGKPVLLPERSQAGEKNPVDNGCAPGRANTTPAAERRGETAKGGCEHPGRAAPAETHLSLGQARGRQR